VKYLPLLHFFIRHTYYADGRCFDLRIEPSAPTQRLIRNHRCMLKARSNGVQIIAPVTEESALYIPLPQNATFAFYLYLDNPEFALFTELTEISKLAAPLFSHDQVNSYPVELTLTPRDPEPTECDRSSSQPARGSFAEVEIHCDDFIRGDNPQPATFFIAFEAKQLRWVYYLLTPQERRPYTIADTGENPIHFSEVNCSDLSQSLDPADKVAQALTVRYPNKRRWRFVSDEPVPCQRIARRAIHLRLNDRPIIDALPNPSLQNHTLVTVASNEDPQPEESLYQIVSCFTRPFEPTS
jgi:hypothetical protein